VIAYTSTRRHSLPKVLFGLLFGAFAATANAQYTCTGTVDFVNQAYDGSVIIDSTALYGNETGRQVCNLNTSWNGVTPAVCQGWLAKLLSAIAQGTPLTVQYNDALTACSQQPVYGSATNPWAMW
jgi:hypothetical protein